MKINYTFVDGTVSEVEDSIGAKQEDTIAFGDAKIDITMFAYCKMGVAMGNSGPEIREAADFITKDVEDDGMYDAFVKLGLLKK